MCSICAQVHLDSLTDASERETLLALCHREFRSQLPEDRGAYTLTLQVKSEDWRGLFIDFVEQGVVHKAVFKLIAVPRAVSVISRVHSRCVSAFVSCTCIKYDPFYIQIQSQSDCSTATLPSTSRCPPTAVSDKVRLLLYLHIYR